MCGIIGVSHHKEAANIAFLGLWALQHRGEEAAGIAVSDGKVINIIKKQGLVVDAFDQEALARMKGTVAIGHCRYSTTGSSTNKNIQPFMVIHKNRPIAVAHNGNLTNTAQLYRRLESEGAIFQTSMDSEIIVHLLVRNNGRSLRRWLTQTLSQLEGAYSLVFLIGDTLVGARDPHGFRPLCLGRLGRSYVLASESCALDIINARFLREVQPGEVVVIHKDQMKSFFLPHAKRARRAHCIFELIYFARPDSHIFDDNVYEVRKRLGVQLAREHPVADADFVMPIPDSGVYAALGYAQQLGLPFEMGMIRNHYIGRTFIQPSQFLRDFRVKVKLNPIRDVLKGKKVVVIEDSIVRGTTSRSRIEVLRKAGAKEIHMRISCPPIVSPCYFGIDFPDRKELIAARTRIDAIARFIQVDSLEYLSLEGMLSVVKEAALYCTGCFTGRYPVAVPRRAGKQVMETSMQ